MALPILIPVAVGALVLAGCTKVATEIRKAQPLGSLEGSEWGPASSGGADQFVGFKRGGEIIGHGGCNDFFGQYTQEGTSLKIGALATTKKLCRGAMQAEAAFIQTLQDTRRAEATHKALTLYGADNDVLLVLRRRDWD